MVFLAFAMEFTTLVGFEDILIQDNYNNKKAIPLSYQYTIRFQALKNAKPFRDDPRIINQTGGDGPATDCG